MTFCTFPTIIQVKKPSIGRIRLRGSRRRGEDFSTSKIQDGVHSAIEWRKSRKRRENLRLDGGRGGARAPEVLTSGRGFLDLVSQPLRRESTSTPLANSHDATLMPIVIPLLPNNFKSRDVLIYCVIYL